MTTPRYYRPKRKDDLIRHLETEHLRDYGPGHVPINDKMWTLAALTEEHDGLHKRRIVAP